MYSGSESGWELSGTLDDTNAAKSSGGSRAGFGNASPVGRLNSVAFNTFRNADSRGVSNTPGQAASSTESELFTVHQNTITSVRAYDGAPGAVSRVSTSGVDGKLVIWDTNTVSPVQILTGKMGGIHLK